MLNAQQREKGIFRTSIIGILANVFLASFKALAGLISGSIAIVLDAVNNLTDALSSIITIVGIKLARRRPDEDHPFGHGRMEYFSTLLISAIVLSAGIMSLVESVKKIFAPEIADYSFVTILIIVMAVAVKFFLGRYVKAQGEKYNSDALVASGTDASFDAIISASTLLGAVVTLMFHITIDGIIGAVISCFIIKAGVEMLGDAMSNVLGKRPDSGLTGALKETVNGIEGVQGTYDVIVHNYGPDSALGSLHVAVDADLTAADLHRLTVKIQRTLQEKFHLFVTVGFYSLDHVHAHERARLNTIAVAHDGVLNTHGVYIDDAARYMSMDVMTDFHVKSREELGKELQQEFQEVLPGYEMVISFDTNYSD